MLRRCCPCPLGKPSAGNSAGDIPTKITVRNAVNFGVITTNNLDAEKLAVELQNFLVAALTKRVTCKHFKSIKINGRG